MLFDERTIRQILAAFPKCAVLIFDSAGVYRLAEGEVLHDLGADRASFENRKAPILSGVIENIQAVGDAVNGALQGQSRQFETTSHGRFYENVAGPLRDEDDAVTGGFIISRDVTHRRRNEMQRIALSRNDPLTGVGNRSRFQSALRRALMTGTPFCLLFGDLDGFKALNDSQGHAAGDQCLVAVSRALEASTRATDVVCRVGGDEFAIVLQPAGAPEAAVVTKRIRMAIHELPFEVGISIGVACYPADGNEPNALSSAADAAMYRDKRARRGGAHAR